MKKFTLPLLLTTALLNAEQDSTLSSNSMPTHCPNGHDHGAHYTPIGVMSGHMHKTGEWMLSYRYMFMNMQDNFSGTNELSIPEVFSQGYMVSPVDMQMEMHMIGLMYAPCDHITLIGMLNLVSLEMLHERSPMAQMNMGGPRTFSTSSSGWGDSSIGALVRFYESDNHNIHGGLSLSLPTAETDKKDEIPGPGKTTLPYPMQLGSGSWGLKPSLTYLGHYNALSWGAQVSAQFHLSDNDNGYRLGDSLTTNLWGALQLTDNLSSSLRAQSSSWKNIEGQHEDLLPLPVPTADPDLHGGNKIDAFWGLSYNVSPINLRVSAEIGKTLWQDLDGPQLGSDWSLTLGAQTTF